mgnify:CR=1 FL=1
MVPSRELNLPLGRTSAYNLSEVVIGDSPIRIGIACEVECIEEVSAKIHGLAVPREEECLEDRKVHLPVTRAAF